MSSEPGNQLEDPVWWYRAADHLVHGPFSLSTLRDIVSDADLPPDTLVSPDRTLPPSSWTRLDTNPLFNPSSPSHPHLRNDALLGDDEATLKQPTTITANTEAANAETQAAVAVARERKRQARKRARQAAAARRRQTTAVYVTGLPPDVDAAAVAKLFAKCGLILPDPDTGRPRVKLYTGPDGVPKGDALVTFALRPSVENAITLLDGAPFHPGGSPNLTVEEASFDHKRARTGDDANDESATHHQKKRGDINEDENGSEGDDASTGRGGSRGKNSDDEVSNRNGSTRPPQIARDRRDGDDDVQASKAKRSRAGMRSREIVRNVLSWADDVADERTRRSSAATIIILQNVFDPSVEVDYALIEIDMQEGCGACGQVDRITVFERNPQGTVAVRFQTAEDALACIRLMDGRWYDGRKLIAKFFDGQTDYRYKETEKDRQIRDKAWSQWLENDRQGNATSGDRPADKPVERTGQNYEHDQVHKKPLA